MCKKGFCARFGADVLRRKFSGRLKMSHFATLSAQIYWAMYALGMELEAIQFKIEQIENELN